MQRPHQRPPHRTRPIRHQLLRPFLRDRPLLVRSSIRLPQTTRLTDKTASAPVYMEGMAVPGTRHILRRIRGLGLWDQCTEEATAECMVAQWAAASTAVGMEACLDK